MQEGGENMPLSGSLPTGASMTPSSAMDDAASHTTAPAQDTASVAPQPAQQESTGGMAAPDFPGGEVSGSLRPANEVVLERLVPSSAMLRKRAFSSLLRVLLTGKGE